MQKDYGCVYYHKRGTTVCTNSTLVGMDILDSALLHSLREALDERILEEGVQRALKKIRTDETQFSDRELALNRELSLVETRLRHLVEAIARGQGSDSLFASLREEEARKKVVVGQLADLNNLGNVTSLDAKALVRNLRRRLRDMKALLARHVPETRQMVRQLIEGKLICRPILEGSRLGFQFASTGTYGDLLQCTNESGGGQGI
ncbi:MAG TPA: hypothetical protein VHQ67_03405 [Nitrospiraceae bacterium]|nr:hypothetical protein [Nitrospiraceae bacterium]